MSQITVQYPNPPTVAQPASAVLRARVSAELENLSAELTRTAGATAASGNRRGRVQIAALQARVRWLGQLLAGLSAPTELNLRADSAGFGATVVVTDLDSGARTSWTLMSGTSMDVGADQVSMESPIGACLIGARPGDEVEAHVPAGIRRLRVEEVTTLLRKFGVEATNADRPSRRTTAQSA